LINAGADSVMRHRVVGKDMGYWAALYLEDTQGLINAGADLVMKTAIELFAKKQGGQSMRMIMDGGSRLDAVGDVVQDEEKNDAVTVDT
jgi:hypothetical protein